MTISRWTWGVGTILVIVFLALVTSTPSPIPDPRTAGGTSLRIATANLSFENGSPADATRVFTKLDLDVLVVQEWTGTNLEIEVLHGISMVPILDEPRDGTHGWLILARKPLQVQASLLPAPVEGPCRLPLVSMRVLSNTGAVSILGVHAPPPIRECANTTAPTLQMVASWVTQGKVAEKVGVTEEDDPVIVLGDLNALPQSRGLRTLLRQGLTDAYSRTHWRPGPTYAPVRLCPAMFRIDYLLVPGEMTVRDSWNLSIPGSDHRLVMAEIEITQVSEGQDE